MMESSTTHLNSGAPGLCLSTSSTESSDRAQLLPIHLIRRDGDTHGRADINPEIVAEYTELMREGIEFPPVRVWFDGTHYWLADGFLRVASSEELGLSSIHAVILLGSLTEAQWDGLCANGEHGQRRTQRDIHSVLERAFQHPNGFGLSNSAIAKQLKIPEATVRRWRQKLSSSHDEDNTRLAVRRGKAYPISISRIGAQQKQSINRMKSKRDFEWQLSEMRETASPEVRRILSILKKWILCGALHTDCVAALEVVVQELMPPAQQRPKTGVSAWR